MKSVRKNKKISTMVLWGLLACIATAYVITSVLTIVVESKKTEQDAKRELIWNIQDVRKDLDDQVNADMVMTLHKIREAMEEKSFVYDMERLNTLVKTFDVTEIHMIDSAGIIYLTTYPDFIGFDMSSGEQSAQFMCLIDSLETFVQEFRPISYDSTIWRKYAGIHMPQGGFFQVGFDKTQFQKNNVHFAEAIANNRHIGENGYVLVSDENGIILSGKNVVKGRNIREYGLPLNKELARQMKMSKGEINGESAIWMYSYIDGYFVVAVIPESQVNAERDLAIRISGVNVLFIFVFLFITIFLMLKRFVVDNVLKINRKLGEISKGNLDVSVDVYQNLEFSSLSDDINMTVDTLKKYIKDAEHRNEAELEFAKIIQKSSLPVIPEFFAGLKIFDIYATMNAAKEVGGDFYDFYFIEKNRLLLLIADVSGKGIPAAMFMMKAKSTIKSFAKPSYSVDSIISHANKSLCENNEAEMFVTNWTGIVDLSTGIVEYANAGHNPPLVCHANGNFEYVKSKPDFVLAGMETSRYAKNTLQLEKGDVLFLYTDGVTEAMNEAEELYGEKRLQEVLNTAKCKSMEEMCQVVREDIATFVGSASQSDDITMLAFRFEGAKG